MLQLLAVVSTVVFFPMMLLQVLLGALIYWIGRLSRSKRLRTHGKDLAMAADQNLNTIWLGYPDETVSSRTGRAMASGEPKWYIKHILCPFVDRAAQVFGDEPNHCARSIETQLHMDSQYEIWKWSRPANQDL